ncbi:hypothetical protein GLOTRDRAFT_125297 [Gloeophyllum trabeum ATCC 11539]|uniref:Uncharacterized protein n=1 Tax=Gloeophyllum trabeum (strain ATCC 11539 / FP-39264 / Madison 617) TaxID=670483 RepID=S7QIE1_GLOTA|nr:uncharacterized protein GLOTRDRAFT_125297 [Gloeophyllum trabeum ATCC 11539]EPQ58978.1 hypothetical protein GLOTRDRAFT_125297 [Gloeophyllum trabeum ATCC 11539]
MDLAISPAKKGRQAPHCKKCSVPTKGHRCPYRARRVTTATTSTTTRPKRPSRRYSARFCPETVAMDSQDPTLQDELEMIGIADAVEKSHVRLSRGRRRSEDPGGRGRVIFCSNLPSGSRVEAPSGEVCGSAPSPASSPSLSSASDTHVQLPPYAVSTHPLASTGSEMRDASLVDPADRLTPTLETSVAEVECLVSGASPAPITVQHALGASEPVSSGSLVSVDEVYEMVAECLVDPRASSEGAPLARRPPANVYSESISSASLGSEEVLGLLKTRMADTSLEDTPRVRRRPANHDVSPLSGEDSTSEFCVAQPVTYRYNPGVLDAGPAFNAHYVKHEDPFIASGALNRDLVDGKNVESWQARDYGIQWGAPGAPSVPQVNLLKLRANVACKPAKSPAKKKLPHSDWIQDLFRAGGGPVTCVHLASLQDARHFETVARDRGVSTGYLPVHDGSILFLFTSGSPEPIARVIQNYSRHGKKERSRMLLLACFGTLAFALVLGFAFARARFLSNNSTAFAGLCSCASSL